MAIEGGSGKGASLTSSYEKEHNEDTHIVSTLMSSMLSKCKSWHLFFLSLRCLPLAVLQSHEVFCLKRDGLVVH